MKEKGFDEFKEDIILELQKDFSKYVIHKYILPGLELTANFVGKAVIKQVNKNAIHRKTKR